MHISITTAHLIIFLEYYFIITKLPSILISLHWTYTYFSSFSRFLSSTARSLFLSLSLFVSVPLPISLSPSLSLSFFPSFSHSDARANACGLFSCFYALLVFPFRNIIGGAMHLSSPLSLNPFAPYLPTTSCTATSPRLIPRYRLPRIPARATLTWNTFHKVTRCRDTSTHTNTRAHAHTDADRKLTR